MSDVENPSIAEPDTLYATSSDGLSVSLTYVTPAAADNSGSATVACLPASGSNFDVPV